MTDREALLADSRLILNELSDNTAIDAECDELYEEMDILAAKRRTQNYSLRFISQLFNILPAEQ